MRKRPSRAAVVALLACFGSGLAGQAWAASPTLDRIRARGAIALGYREASIPFSYLGEDQKPTGFSLDLCGWVVERVRAKLGLDHLAVNDVPVSASNRIPLVQNGTVDIECGSTTNTLERQKQAAFSVATFISQPSWLTTAASPIVSAEGLRGKTVVLTQGSLNLGIAYKINRDDKLDLTITQAKDHGESLLILASGRAAAFFEDNVLLAGVRASARDPKAFRFLPDVYPGYYYYGLMFQRDDPDFKALVDDVLKEKMASGDFARVYARWFTQPIPPHGQTMDLPMSAALKARIAAPSDVLTP